MAKDKNSGTKTLEYFADSLRSGPGSYKKEKEAAAQTARTNERVGAMTKAVTEMFGARAKTPVLGKAQRRYGAK